MIRNTTRWQSSSSTKLSNPSIRRLRKYAAIASQQPETGDKIHGFTVQRKKHVPGLELTALHLQHDKTGAEYLHVARDDKNNVFSIGFKTNPPDHTGVPHILEHLALCGSERYPVRDPFFKMMPRSLSNFMNAMTYPDHTVYPFATTNPQDFKNLMSVYMDATLHPLLRSQDFAQEGWRVGPENSSLANKAASPGEEDRKLVFKGVVYNEMKGSLSNADSLFHTRWQEGIFPALNNSGGDPQKITDLTHAQLQKFHADHYHPSNAKLFTYGDMPLIDHLMDIGPQLDRFDKINPSTHLPIPISLNDGPQTKTVSGPADPLYPQDQQFKASLTWMTCDTSNVLDTFSLGIISSLLLDGFSSPVYQNTIEIGWGAAYTPNTGFDSSSKIGTFTVGLSGLKKSDIGRMKGGLRNTFEHVKRKGFDLSKIEGCLHQIELSLKHKTAHFGMGLMSRLQDGWFNGIDPFTTVDPEEVISAFKLKLQQDRYLEGVFAKYLLSDNTFQFIMEPSTAFGGELVAEEVARLDTKIKEISSHYNTAEDATRALEKQELELLEMQEAAKADNLDCLPTLRVSDISRQLERKDVRHSSIGDTKVQWREAPTNGLTYFRAIQTLENLPDELRIYLPLFSSAIHRLGTKSMQTEELENMIKLKTGGIGVSHHSSPSPEQLDVFEEGLAFTGHALDRNIPAMYELLRLIVHETDFDKRGAEEKIKELIKGYANGAINEVVEAGSSYASRFAQAGLSPEARVSEEIDGLTQIRLMMDLAGRAERIGYGDVLDKLKAIQSFMLSGGSSLRIALTCGSESSSANENALQKFLSQLPSTSPPIDPEQMPYPRDVKSFFPLPYQVYYTASAMRTVPYTHAASPALQILAELLTHKRMHHEIREKGGAYGASASNSALRGIFGFSSYRDPNPINSLKLMQEAGAWARDRRWTDQEIEEAKLSVFQSIDAPRSVSSEGMTKFLTGISEDMRQERRERMLDVSGKEVNDVANEYLVEPRNGTNIAVLGKIQDWVSAENGWLEMPLGAMNEENVEGTDEMLTL